MRRFLLIPFLSIFCITGFGQVPELRDSIQASTKTDTIVLKRTVDGICSYITEIRSVGSPLGEGDPIKWVQGLPGVTTGADGSSAFYVRGGNAGNNRFSIDRVPIYGYTHMLGLTTVIPLSVIDNVSLSKGGFSGSDYNFTSSHLKISSRIPQKEKFTSISANNFMISASDERKLSDRISYLASIRLSPLGLEYGLLRNCLSNNHAGIDNFNAAIGDFYGKMYIGLESGRTIDISAMVTLDKYTLSTKQKTGDSIGWGNAFIQMRYNTAGITDAEYSLYVNHFESFQEQKKIYREEYQQLRLDSGLTEFTACADWSREFTQKLNITYGTRAIATLFNPGQIADISNEAWTILVNSYLQLRYDIPDRFNATAYIRGNCFSNFDTARQSNSNGLMFNPEGGASAAIYLGKCINIEASVDRTVQNFHNLEGLPVGWSLDLIVPSSRTIEPERAFQTTIGGAVDLSHHMLSVKGYYKWMDNLVFYKYSQSLFNGGMADWIDNVSQGQGQSIGCEALYQYQNKDLYARVSYTISRTDRIGFPDICDGQVFNARFDRRHILNVVARWKGFNVAYTIQSGHWENGASQKYSMSIPGNVFISDYYSGINDYHMPAIMRLDLSYEFSAKIRNAMHFFSIGIWNATNHFNPFMIYFDENTEEWKQLALLPILPNISWRVEF